MTNILYRKVVVGMKESADGETPTIVFVTEENNGYGVFLQDYEMGIVIKNWETNREIAIENGVHLAESIIKMQEKAKKK